MRHDINGSRPLAVAMRYRGDSIVTFVAHVHRVQERNRPRSIRCLNKCRKSIRENFHDERIGSNARIERSVIALIQDLIKQ